MANQSYTHQIQTDGDYVNVSDLTGFSFKKDKTYTLYVGNSAFFKLGNAIFPVHNQYIKYSLSDDALMIKTDYMPCTLTVYENGKSVAVTGIELSTSWTSVSVEQTNYLYAYVYPYDATEQGIIWTCENNNVEIQPNGNECVITGVNEGYDNVTAITVDGGYSATCYVQVTDRQVSYIEVTSYPYQTTYYQGDYFNPEGMVVTAHFNDTTQTDLYPDEVQFSPSGALGPDDNVITISYTYRGNTVTTDFYIELVACTGIYVANPPAKTTYDIGENLDLYGMEVYSEFDNGDFRSVYSYTCTPADGDTLQFGDNSIYISAYIGGIEYTTTQAITVGTLSSFTVTTPPNKTSYLEGEDFDPTGMIVTAEFRGGYTMEVDDYTILYDKNLAHGSQVVRIEWVYNGDTQFTIQQISVAALQSIAVTHAPKKTSYVVGDFFETSSMEVTATWVGGSTEVIDDYTYSPTTALSTSDTAITISCTRGTTTVTTNQAISVYGLSSIYITKPPYKTTYYTGELFEPGSMGVSAVYDNGTEVDVTGEYTYSPTGALNSNTTGITVSYTAGGVTKTTTQPITMITLSSIYVSKTPNKISYTAGETFSFEGGTVTAVWSDNSETDVTNYITCSPSGALTTNDTTITISYTVADQTQTTTQAITVSAPAYPSYAVGDTIVLDNGKDRDTFMVIEASNGTSSTVKAIATLPVSDSTYEQGSGVGFVVFGSNDNYTTSSIKTSVDTYASRLYDRYNVTATGNLLWHSELSALNGSTVTLNTQFSPNMPKFIYDTTYWIRRNDEGSDTSAYYIEEKNEDLESSTAPSGAAALRPVLTFDKNEIQPPL